MLIERNQLPEVNDIVTLKLTSGEEIVGKLTAQASTTLTISKPIAINLHPVNASQMSLAFLPVLGSVEPDAPLVIAKTAIAIMPLKTSESVRSTYIEMTSGLVTVGNSNGIIL